MSLFARRHSTIQGPTTVPPWGSNYPTGTGSVSVTNETALRHSAVWACLQRRANLVSTMPVDTYRRINGVQIEVNKPPVLVNPGGERVGIIEWLHATQFDLDRAGNAFGLITERDSRGNPSRIDLVPISEVSVTAKGSEVTSYRISGTVYTPDQVWHEKQNPTAGFPLGLSPVANAALSIGEYLSIQQFALDWFGNATVPAGHLRNTALEMDQPQASEMKLRFQSTIKAGEAFVTGKDWEYTPLTSTNHQTEWIEGKQFGIADIARFFDCPGDLIDADVSAGNITYANVTQRNLQFLVHHLGPAIARREAALSKLVSDPIYVKLNTDALLRMDPQTRATTIRTQVDGRVLANDEARELDDRPPLTETQKADFDRIYGAASASKATPSTAPSIGS